MAQQKERIFTPSQSRLQNSFFQKGTITHQQGPQKVSNSYQFTYETMPKVNCHYHTEQYITMFCRNPSCYMPLCPQCVKIHSQEHQSCNTYGDFDTLENCLSEAYHIVANHCNQFVDHLNIMSKHQVSTEGIQNHMDKVKQARQQCHQVIDNFFNTLEAELAGELEGNNKFLSSQSGNFSKYLQGRWKTLMAFLEKLNSDKCVKSLVKFYCSDFERENEEYYHESNQFTKQLQRCTPEIIIDQSAIYQLNVDLARFVSLKQVAQYKPQQRLPTHEFVSQQQQYQQHQSKLQQTLAPLPLGVTQPMGLIPVTSQEYPHQQQQQQQPLRDTVKPHIESTSSIHPYLLTPPKTTNFYYDNSNR